MKTGALLGALAAMALTTPAAEAATAKRSTFGKLPDGRSIAAVTLANGRGVSVNIIAYGAGIQSLIMPDRTGKKADVALGHASIDGYLIKPNFVGSTVGRFANRIAGGRFKLGNQTYQTPLNDGRNALHGGTNTIDIHIVSGTKSYPGFLSPNATFDAIDLVTSADARKAAASLAAR